MRRQPSFFSSLLSVALRGIFCLSLLLGLTLVCGLLRCVHIYVFIPAFVYLPVLRGDGRWLGLCLFSLSEGCVFRTSTLPSPGSSLRFWLGGRTSWVTIVFSASLCASYFAPFGGAAAARYETIRNQDNRPEGERSQERTLGHMEVYAREGLRTLLVACSDLDGDWFLAWDKRCQRVVGGGGGGVGLVEVVRRGHTHLCASLP